MNIRAIIFATAAALVGGCAVGPDFHPPKPAEEPKPQWTTLANPPPPTTVPASTQPTTRQSAAIPDRPAELTEWWKRFNDPELDSLVTRAVESNLDLKQAEARIRQARATRGVVWAGLWPSLDASGSYTRSGSERSGVSNSSLGSTSSDLYRAGLDASWEIDVFGGVRRSVEAAEADIAAAVEDRRDVLITLTSEVALSYLDLRGFQHQLAIARQNLAAQQRSADITRQRQRGGFVSALDVANADAQVAATLSTIPLLEQQTRQNMYSIAVLLGRQPGTLVDELTAVAPTIPQVSDDVPIGLPSELLRRRPDVRRSEAQLHAATAQIGVATADLFPRILLNGSVGTQGTKVKSLANWSNSFWSFGPSISFPLFDAGRIFSNIDVQKSVQEQAFLTYQQAVLTAFQDVENALVAHAQEQQRRAALVSAVEANRRAVDLSTRLYQQGQTDFLNVLNAQRSLFVSEDTLAQSDVTVAQNLVRLYKSLGGGWEDSSNQ